MLIKLMTLILLLSNSFAWSKDLTAIYLSKKNTITEKEHLRLKQFKVLVIPGVLSESFLSDGNNKLKLTFLFDEAFKEQINLLKKLKTEYEFLKLESENSPAKNAIDIINSLEKSSLPVIIYSHSKGGLDLLEALSQRPDLLSKIHGWASIQSPFWGTSIASGLMSDSTVKSSTENLFRWMGGDAGGMSSLTVEERSAYMDADKLKKLLLEINTKIKFVNYASTKTNTFGVDTPLEIFRNYIDDREGANDGVVSLKTALMKEHGIDIDFIIESEVDHLMTMTRYYLMNSSYDQQWHTLAILKLLL